MPTGFPGRVEIVCPGCGQTRYHRAKGLCKNCYQKPFRNSGRGVKGQIQKPWTPREIAQLKRLCLEGKSRAEMSRILNRSENSLRGAITRYGLAVKGRPTPQECGRLMREIQRLHKSGVRTGKAIAAEVGRSPSCVLGWLRRMGLSRRQLKAKREQPPDQEGRCGAAGTSEPQPCGSVSPAR